MIKTTKTITSISDKRNFQYNIVFVKFKYNQPSITSSLNIFKAILYLFLLTIILLIPTHCSSTKSTYPSNHKKITNATTDALNAQFYFWKNSDTSAMVYTMIQTEPLLYARLDTGLQFYASIKITIALYSISKNKFYDSTSVVCFIPQNQATYFHSFPIKISNDNFNAKITITDLNKKLQYSYFTEIKLNNDFTRNNFLLTQNNKILFKPYAIEGSKIQIYHPQKFSSLNVDMFKYHHSPAPPPFSNFSPSINYLPDSSFTLRLIDNSYYEINIQPNVFYHIRANTQTLDGITIFSIDSIFPNIKDAKEMLYVTRYIMNKNEFERCLNTSQLPETKKCIDNFWIQIAGSKERAKEMIKNYYQRVIDANQLFTSYKYGWQTDRGMIFIVFGPPEEVQKTINSEKWLYSLNGQKNALMFNFVKNKNNPFTTSDFILERSDYYKDIWYLAVDQIRQGRLSVR